MLLSLTIETIAILPSLLQPGVGAFKMTISCHKHLLQKREDATVKTDLFKLKKKLRLVRIVYKEDFAFQQNSLSTQQWQHGCM